MASSAHLPLAMSRIVQPHVQSATVGMTRARLAKNLERRNNSIGVRLLHDQEVTVTATFLGEPTPMRPRQNPNPIMLIGAVPTGAADAGIDPNREAAASDLSATLPFRFVPSSLPGVIDVPGGLSPCSIA